MRLRDGRNSDPGSGMEKSRIRDREKHPGSATLSVIIEDESKNLCWLKICLLTLSAGFTRASGIVTSNLSPNIVTVMVQGHAVPMGASLSQLVFRLFECVSVLNQQVLASILQHAQ